jgi:prepilin-type N-terminal cleavage/methylation domain-containing protein
MKRSTRRKRVLQAGFSLVEMLVVVAILLIVMASVFSQVAPLQTRAAAEAGKVETFQSGREALEQFTRDLHQAGYPNAKMYAAGVLASPTQDSRVAATYGTTSRAGLVQVTPTSIIFEGDVDGDGIVDSVRYRLVATDAALSANCPCLERSQVNKVTADPLAGQGFNYSVLVENALMPAAGPPVVSSVFEYFANDGTQVAVGAGLDVNANAAALANIRTVRINLTAQTAVADVKTGARPLTAISATSKISN